MSHYVICSKCGCRFDRDKIQAVRTGARRYAHASCDPDNKDLVPLVNSKKEDPDLQKLKEYIAQLFGDKVNWALVNKQIKKFKEKNGYSYSGMLKSLIYFFEVKGNSIEKSKGIGIVEYTYQDAFQYYYNLYMAQEANKNKTLFTQIKEIIIKPPRSKPQKKKFFDLKEWEE